MYIEKKPDAGFYGHFFEKNLVTPKRRDLWCAFLRKCIFVNTGPNPFSLQCHVPNHDPKLTNTSEVLTLRPPINVRTTRLYHRLVSRWVTVDFDIKTDTHFPEKSIHFNSVDLTSLVSEHRSQETDYAL